MSSWIGGAGGMGGGKRPLLAIIPNMPPPFGGPGTPPFAPAGMNLLGSAVKMLLIFAAGPRSFCWALTLSQLLERQR